MKKPTEKPDTALVRAAKVAGVQIHRASKQKSDETLLDYRCRDWKIPRPTFAVIDDNVICWRLPPLELSAGGVVIPEDQRSPHVKGILLAMGPRARDILVGNGIDLGHIVIWGRFAGWEAHDQTPEYLKHNQIIMLKAKDIVGSDDLKAMLESGKLSIVQGEDGKHRLAKISDRPALPAKEERREKILRLANGTPSAHEADTARKIAERT